MLDERVSTLIERIYEGASDPHIWDRALQDLLGQTGSYIGLVCPTDLNRDEIFQCRYYGPDDSRLIDGANEYVTELYRADPMLHFGARNPAAGFVKLSMAVPPSRQDDVEYVRWIKSLLGVREFVVRYTTPQNGLSLAMALIPRPDRDAHDDNDLRLFSLIFPHVSHALHLATRPPAVIMEGEPTLLLDKRGRVHAMNCAAEALVEDGDGLVVERGFLIAALRSEQRLFDAALRSALTYREGGIGADIRLARRSGRRPLLVSLRPLAQSSSAFDALRAAAVVTIVDPDGGASVSATSRWSTLYALTPAETRLAAALLVEEGSLRSIAERIGIAYATARVQLTSLFDKTGVRSQTQLIRLLTRLSS